MKNFLTSFFLLVSFSGFSQSYPGYIVIDSGDTLSGYLSFFNSYQRTAFFLKTSEISKKKKKYKPKNVKYVEREKNGKTEVWFPAYVSPFGWQFLRQVDSSGYYKLYRLSLHNEIVTGRSNDKSAGTVTNKVKQQNILIFACQLGNEDLLVIPWSHFSWKKGLKNIVKDYEELVSQIDNKEFAYSEIPEIIELYNAWKELKNAGSGSDISE